jgi:hypothetical protein
MRARILTRIFVGAICLLANGWKKARHFDKFWFHIPLADISEASAREKSILAEGNRKET